MAPSNRDDTSVDIEALEKTSRDKLGGGSLLSDTSCIFRVPEVLRENNMKAYQPEVVAIGPLHAREQKQYQHMEKVKWWYLRKYILFSKKVDLAKLIEDVTEKEKRARDCYAESLDIEPNKFIEMMILDGCFIVELFRKVTYKNRKLSDGSQPKEDGPSEPKEVDPILGMDCMIQYICHDILLLENQLPWDVLRSIFDHTRGNNTIHESLSELILDFFIVLPYVVNCMPYLRALSHFGDEGAEHKHVLDLVRFSILYLFKEPKPSDDEIDFEKKYIPPATTLSKGGVKFENVSNINGKISIVSVEFEDGVLRIPQLVIGDLTETLFRNLIALEQCSRSHSYEITSYAVLMSKLISSKEDMEFLCEKDIMRNWLSAEDGFKFFNKIHNDTYSYEFHYYGLCNSVNSYYNVKYFRWMEILWREYFDTPWTIISLIAAIILLVLTLVQTIFTVLN